MMRLNKNGEQAIPKAVWSAKVELHRGFAENLTELLNAHPSESTGALADALREEIQEHNWRAQKSAEAEMETRKGQPRKKILNKLAAFLRPVKKQTAAQRNRRIFEIVERRRTELSSRNRSSGITDAINSLNKELARDISKREDTFALEQFASVHSAYQRGKKLSGA